MSDEKKEPKQLRSSSNRTLTPYVLYSVRHQLKFPCPSTAPYTQIYSCFVARAVVYKRDQCSKGCISHIGVPECVLAPKQ